MAILHSKAERAGYNIPDEIIALIGRKFQSNIRELEGALTRVVAYADLRNMQIDHELIDAALADLLPQRKDIHPDQIIDAVAHAYNVPIERLLGRERSQSVARPRQIAMYLIREETNTSLPQIGDALGGRDHTTVMYGHEKISDLLERDDKLRRQVLDIKGKLYN
jgi:chromosomal replication initiator protein